MNEIRHDSVEHYGIAPIKSLSWIRISRRFRVVSLSPHWGVVGAISISRMQV